MNKMLIKRDKQSADMSVKFFILLLLDELSILSTPQIMKLIEMSDFTIKRSAIYNNLNYLLENEMINFSHVGNKKTDRCYYLTKYGHQYIGSEYKYVDGFVSMYKKLVVNDYVIDIQKQLELLPNLWCIESERRLIHELSDMNNKTIKPYQHSKLMAELKIGARKLNLYFEIEAVAYSHRRYVEFIFPRYINILKEKPTAHVVFIGLNDYLDEWLESYKEYLRRKLNQENLSDYYPPNIFDRIHIFNRKDYNSELKILLDDLT